MTKNQKNNTMKDTLLPKQATNNFPTWRQWRSALFGTFMMFGLAACNAQPPDGTPSPKPAVKLADGTLVNLALKGYNYTNIYIYDFSVDGQGGDNLRVSGPSSGGGGSVCCVSYRTRAVPAKWKVKVRWHTAACTYNERISGGETFSDTYKFHKEVEVEVDPNVPDNPGYFEVHIYPDGHVEAAITEHDSYPRLKLNEDREDRSDYPRCPNDKKPKE